jgi:TRAP-type C4-dicarboxylate transport system substrate-binding protein
MRRPIIIKSLFMAATFVLTIPIFFAPAQGAEPTAENPLVLKYAMLVPPTHFLLNPEIGPSIWWAREVEKRTGGRVKVKWFPSRQLGKSKDHFDLARTGVADAAGFVHGYTPGFFPLTTIVELPFPAPGMSFDVAAKALWELHKRGLLDKMYKEVKVLTLDPTEQYQLFLKKKVTKIEDLKGVKLRSFGGVWPAILKAWGATPVPMPISDAYMGVQRGIIAGLPHNWAAAPSWKTYEVIDYVIETNTSCAAIGSVMNLKTWKSMPPDIQKIIDGVNEEMVGFITTGSEEKGVLGYELYGLKKARPLYIEKGIEVYKLAPAEMDNLAKAVLPLWDEWVERMEAKGLPGKKVMKEYLSILKGLGAKPVYEPTW